MGHLSLLNALHSNLFSVVSNKIGYVKKKMIPERIRYFFWHSVPNKNVKKMFLNLKKEQVVYKCLLKTKKGDRKIVQYTHWNRTKLRSQNCLWGSRNYFFYQKNYYFKNNKNQIRVALRAFDKKSYCVLLFCSSVMRLVQWLQQFYIWFLDPEASS